MILSESQSHRSTETLKSSSLFHDATDLGAEALGGIELVGGRGWNRTKSCSH